MPSLLDDHPVYRAEQVAQGKQPARPATEVATVQPSSLFQPILPLRAINMSRVQPILLM